MSSFLSLVMREVTGLPRYKGPTVPSVAPPTGAEYLMGLDRRNSSTSLVFDSRNLRYDFPWNRQVWEIASSSRY